MIIKKISILIIVSFIITNGVGVFGWTNNVNIKPLKMDNYDMVIISPSIFSNQIQRLIEHKNNVGIATFLKTTEEIYNEYNGRDDAEKIKYFIKDAIEQYNIEYILLFGGKKVLSFRWNVPSRYSNLDDGFGHEIFLSDLYFADVYKENGEFDNWDSNDNGIFAEWGFTGDDLDLKPDIAVGRLPCRTKKEAENVIEKIITYENTIFGENWFNRFIVIGGDTFPDYEGYEGEFTCDTAAEYMDDFDIVKLYTSTGELNGPEDIINEVNQGCGFLMTRGRGGTDRIRMVMPEGLEFIAFNINYISELSNEYMNPICILGECIHGRFDVGILNILKVIQGDPEYNIFDCIPECIAWRLVKEKKNGAIACITNTNICFGAFGDNDDNGILDDAEMYGGFLAVEFFRLYGDEGLRYLGDIFMQSILNYIEKFPVHSNKIHSKSIQEYVLIGDPSLKIGGYN
jgi:hypothetical protein